MVFDKTYSQEQITSQYVNGDHNLQSIGNNNTFNIYSGDIDFEIDYAANYIDKNHPQITIEFLEKMQKREGLSSRANFRIEANIGHAYDAMGERQKAGRHYLKAYKYDPAYEKARSLEALGYYYLGEYPKAHELAENMTKDFPDNTIAWSVWLFTSQTEYSFEEMEEKVPKDLLEDKNVCFAFAQVASMQNKDETANRYMCKVMSDDINNPSAMVEMGILLLKQADAHYLIKYEIQPNIQQRKLLEDAQSYLSKALEIFKKCSAKDLIVNVYLKRSLIYRALKELDKSNDDIRAAYQESPDNLEAIFQYALLLQDQNNVDKAINLLKKLIENHECRTTVNFFLGSLLYKRNQGNDLADAMSYLTKRINDLTQEEICFRFDYISLLLDVISKHCGYKELLNLSNL